MSRILDVARRDFTATVGSKGFIIGLLFMPVLMLLFVVLGPRIMNARSPQVRGEIAVMDLSGRVTPELRTALDPAHIAALKVEEAKRSGNPVAQNARKSASDLDNIPVLSLVERPASAEIQTEKDWLIQDKSATPHHLAVVVIQPDAVVRAAGEAEYGTYDLYTSRLLDGRTESTLHEALRQALVTTRLKSKGLDQAEVEASMRVARPNAVIVAAAGEQASQRWLTRMLPFVCGVLLFIGVFSGGQVLMTSMVEEKSSRVVEVLLAAVSPLELMWGKLIAQLGVSLLILAVYCGLGLLALVQFATVGLMDPMLLVYLAAFFIIAYLIFGGLMLTIGAAVDQMADTQGLMGPIMILLLAPYVLTGMIGQAPNSALSVTLSFIPPINTFAMLARLASDTPPPAWQVVLAIVIGFAAAVGVLWFAAKVFRIGLLMHGKPPNFATMLRWARMA
jgi:ABC-2 type transport system permease protein